MDTVVLFEGIGTFTIDGVEHDAYVKVKGETIDLAVRWFGLLDWMGEAPKIVPPLITTMTLSDGRECEVSIPYIPADGEKWEFLGRGLPPGFELIVVDAELAGTTPSSWRARFGRALLVSSFILSLDAVWYDNYRTQFVLTSLLFFMGGMGLFIAQRIHEDNIRGRRLPEVPHE